MMSNDIADLNAIYAALDLPPKGLHLYSAQVVPNRPAYRVAKDEVGNPALLLNVLEDKSITTTAPVRLRYLGFQSRCQCRITSKGHQLNEETFAVLKCASNAPILREYFLRSLSGAIAAMPTIPTQDDISDLLEKLVELFRALYLPGRASIQGTWSELFIIYASSKINDVASAWHCDPHELHDFVKMSQHIEVKSTVGRRRVHDFTLEQLSAPKDGELVVASFMLAESDTGWSVRDLWEEVCQRWDLNDELKSRLSRILMVSLGKDWLEARRIKFDPATARQELQIYPAEHIPKIDCRIPEFVSNVRFRSDLTDIQSLKRSELARAGGLYEAVFG